MAVFKNIFKNFLMNTPLCTFSFYYKPYRQPKVAVNHSCLFLLSIYNLFININNFQKFYIIIVISLQRSFLCKLKFIDENNMGDN